MVIKGGGGTITLPAASPKQFGSNTSVPLNINGGILATGGNTLVFDGDFINTGTLTAGSSPITMAGTVATQAIAGFTTTGAVTMSKTNGTATFGSGVTGGSLVINGTGGVLALGAFTHTFTGAFTLTSGTVLATGSTLNIGGNGTFTAGAIFTAGTGTVIYNGAAQTVANLPYNNLTLGGYRGKGFDSHFIGCQYPVCYNSNSIYRNCSDFCSGRFIAIQRYCSSGNRS